MANAPTYGFVSNPANQLDLGKPFVLAGMRGFFIAVAMYWCAIYTENVDFQYAYCVYC